MKDITGMFANTTLDNVSLKTFGNRVKNATGFETMFSGSTVEISGDNLSDQYKTASDWGGGASSGSSGGMSGIGSGSGSGAEPDWENLPTSIYIVSANGELGPVSSPDLATGKFTLVVANASPVMVTMHGANNPTAYYISDKEPAGGQRGVYYYNSSQQGWMVGWVNSASDLNMAPGNDLITTHNQSYATSNAGLSPLDPHSTYRNISVPEYETEYVQSSAQITYPEFLAVSYNFDMSCLVSINYIGFTEYNYGDGVNFTIQGLYQKQTTYTSLGWVDDLPYYKQIKYINRGGSTLATDFSTQEPLYLVYDGQTSGGWCFDTTSPETPNWPGATHGWAPTTTPGTINGSNGFGNTTFWDMNIIQSNHDRRPGTNSSLNNLSWFDASNNIPDMLKVVESDVNAANATWNNSGGTNNDCT